MASKKKKGQRSTQIIKAQNPFKLQGWLGQLGIVCFGLGAMTSTALALHGRTSTPLPLATGTALKVSNVGLLVSTLGNQAMGVFPGEVSASHLCALASPTPLTANGNSAQAEGLVASHLGTLGTTISPDTIAQLGAAPWPNLHELAKLARVPIMMYHDILPEKDVFFDVTPEEFEAHLTQIEEAGLTPISLAMLVQHLRTGSPLPPKPILLTFDDGYEGHYTLVYPLLKKYQYPAVFSVFTGKLDGEVVGRSTLTWEQLAEMAADPLVTIAAHTVTHPPDLRRMTDEELVYEIVESKQRLEARLGIPIRYFTYPAGYYDERVAAVVDEAGYEAALTMSNTADWFAGESESLLAIGRFGQSKLTSVIPQAWEGIGVPIRASTTFDFESPIRMVRQVAVNDITFALVTGGRPVTVHADSRYQVPEILAKTNAVAAVDGGFFSLRYLDSNVMIGPVLSQATKTFVPGNASENPKLTGRPLVLIGSNTVKFVAFDAAVHNTLGGVTNEMPNVTDAFVAAAWLVRDGVPQPPEAFGDLFDFNAPRHRAFWGINRAGQPVVGATKDRVGSVELGELLFQLGLRDAVMLDSGASTSLAYEGESLVDYTPRPVPHLVALIPPEEAQGTCPLVMKPSLLPDGMASEE